jgi:hypothetical protein
MIDWKFKLNEGDVTPRQTLIYLRELAKNLNVYAGKEITKKSAITIWGSDIYTISLKGYRPTIDNFLKFALEVVKQG